MITYLGPWFEIDFQSFRNLFLWFKFMKYTHMPRQPFHIFYVHNRSHWTTVMFNRISQSIPTSHVCSWVIFIYFMHSLDVIVQLWCSVAFRQQQQGMRTYSCNFAWHVMNAANDSMKACMACIRGVLLDQSLILIRFINKFNNVINIISPIANHWFLNQYQQSQAGTSITHSPWVPRWVCENQDSNDGDLRCRQTIIVAARGLGRLISESESGATIWGLRSTRRPWHVSDAFTIALELWVLEHVLWLAQKPMNELSAAYAIVFNYDFGWSMRSWIALAMNESL